MTLDLFIPLVLSILLSVLIASIVVLCIVIWSFIRKTDPAVDPADTDDEDEPEPDMTVIRDESHRCTHFYVVKPRRHGLGHLMAHLDPKWTARQFQTIADQNPDLQERGRELEQFYPATDAETGR
mgnify:CR=1 FL=1